MYNFLVSIFIGIGVILPGVSGSVIAIMLGIYDKVIFLLNNKEEKLLSKFITLFPIMCGIFVGVMIFGNILLNIYNVYQFQMRYIFIGLIFGGIPILFNEVNSKKGVVNKKIILIAFIISLLLVAIPNVLNYSEKVVNNPLKLFLGGILYISGKIIPGISSSFFMMILGLYEYILKIMSNPFSVTLIEFISLIPFILGIILGFLILVKLINYLFKYHLSITYSVIIGFSMGSTFAIFPGLEISFRGFLSIFLLIISFLITNKMSKIKKKNV